MAKFDSKSFNPQAFGAYVNRIPNTKKSELAKSGAVGTNEQAEASLSRQALYTLESLILEEFRATLHRIMMVQQTSTLQVQLLMNRDL